MNQKQLELTEEIALKKLKSLSDKLQDYILALKSNQDENKVLILNQAVKIFNNKKQTELKELCLGLKQALKKEILDFPEVIEVKNFMLELTALSKEIFPEPEIKALATITSLVPFESKEESKTDDNEFEQPTKGQLSFWQDNFDSSKESSFTKVHTSDFDESLKIKFKVTETDDFEEPFLEIKGKLFMTDLYLVRNYIKVFEKGVKNSLQNKLEEKFQREKEIDIFAEQCQSKAVF